MTPSFSIGDEVVVAGPDSSGHCDWLGAKFKIERTAGRDANYYTAYHVPLFPASSLRLVSKFKKGTRKSDPFDHVYPPIIDRFNNIERRLSAIEEREAATRKYSDDLESITETLGNRVYDYEMQQKIDQSQLSVDCSKDVVGIQDEHWRISVEQRLSALVRMCDALKGEIDRMKTAFQEAI